MQVADMGNYAHGNQPAQHMIYLYDYCGQPHKAQWWAREVMDRLYSPKPDGYCGDEDNGQTSAWYVFSAIQNDGKFIVHAIPLHGFKAHFLRDHLAVLFIEHIILLGAHGTDDMHG